MYVSCIFWLFSLLRKVISWLNLSMILDFGFYQNVTFLVAISLLSVLHIPLSQTDTIPSSIFFPEVIKSSINILSLFALFIVFLFPTWKCKSLRIICLFCFGCIYQRSCTVQYLECCGTRLPREMKHTHVYSSQIGIQ